MMPESQKIHSIRQALKSDERLFISREIINTFNTPVIENGKRVMESVTFFIAPVQNLYRVGVLSRALNRIQTYMPESKKYNPVMQGTGKYRSIRFGYLYLDEEIPELNEENKAPSVRNIDIRIYPNLAFAEFLAEYHEAKNRNRTNYELEFESLTQGMLQRDLMRLVRNPAEFLDSLRTE